MKAIRPHLAISLTCGWLIACGGEAEPGRLSLTDSAGVPVVTSHRPQSSDVPGTIGDPEVRIGDEGSELNQVIGAIRLSDGRIVVGDGGNSVLRYFSPAGRLVGTVGGEGDGPSEFRTLQAIGRIPGDTVWAYDFSHHRVTFISPEAEVIEAVSLRPPFGAALAVGVQRDGTIVLGESWSSALVADAAEPGLSRAPVAYLRYSRSGEFLDTLGLFPGRELLLSFEEGRGVMAAPPMGRSAVHALLGQRLAIGDQVAHEFRILSANGFLERIVRWDGGDLSVDSELEMAWRRARLASFQSRERAGEERRLAELVMPATRPAYGRILAAAAGGVWVADYAVDGVEPAKWAVFDAEGVWRESLTMPPSFRPLEVSSNWVLGVSRDQFNVQRVELRPIERRD